MNGNGSYEFCQGFGDFVLWVKVSDDNDKNVRDDEDLDESDGDDDDDWDEDGEGR